MQEKGRLLSQQTRRDAINAAESARGERINWKYTDSPLLGPRPSFDSYFSVLISETGLLGRKLNLKQFVENVLHHKKGNAVGLELGGTASSLFSGFRKGLFKKSAGLNMTDYRLAVTKKEDENQNHTVISENMLNDEAKTKVETWLAGDKVDFIILRMIDGMSDLPAELFYLSKQANFWYEHLADGGLFFTQIPDVFRDTDEAGGVIGEWVKKTNIEYNGRLEIVYNSGMMMIRKLFNAPESLPLLDARFVIEEERKKVQERARHNQERYRLLSTTPS